MYAWIMKSIAEQFFLILLIKLNPESCTGHIRCIEDTRSAYKILVQNYLGRLRRKCEDILKLFLGNIGCDVMLMSKLQVLYGSFKKFWDGSE
jgi:hypothetical protein